MGATVAIPIAAESRMTLFDPVAVALVVAGWRSLNRFYWLVGLLALSLLALAISAIIHASGAVALVSRVYPPVLLLLEAVGYFVLAERTTERGRAALVIGAMLGVCCHYFYPTDERILDEPIKFLIGAPLGVATMAAYAATSREGAIPILPAVILMALYAIFCFLIGSRSIGGTFIISALVLYFIPLLKISRGYARYAPAVLAVFVLAGYGVTELYSRLAIAGYFGDRAADVALFQSSFGSILLGGRPEIQINLLGIAESPMFGVGLMNYPPTYLYDLINLSVYPIDDVYGLNNVLYHSAIFATAFEAGVLAAIFWFMIFYRVAFALPLLRWSSPGRRAYVIPLSLMSIWHLLYSPPIPYNRFVIAAGLGFACLHYAQWLSGSRDSAPLSDAPRAAPRRSARASARTAFRAVATK